MPADSTERAAPEILALFDMARRWADVASDDGNTQTGCVIFTYERGNYSPLIFGVNRLPGNVAKSLERMRRPTKTPWLLHAEHDAIFTAAREGISLLGKSIAIPWFPCSVCARAIVTAGIATVYAHPPDYDHPRYGEDFHNALALLQEGGATLHEVPR